MRDPLEGVGPDGTITTGAARHRVPAAFEPVVRDAVAEFDAASTGSGELHLYGSVANGTARRGRSDVDLVAIDAPAGWAAAAGDRLSRRYADLCRAVQIGSASSSDYAGDDDEAYGNRVFLTHYCVHLAGADAVRSPSAFPGDVRAARGFNGDIGAHLRRWRASGGSARAIARKTLVAAAGIVSVRHACWTTDRSSAVDAWQSIDAREHAMLRVLLDWSDATIQPTSRDLAATLVPGGIVNAVADRFAAEIGLWRTA
jgi:uncharacterized protein